MVFRWFWGHSTITIKWFPAPIPLVSMVFRWFWGLSTIGFNVLLTSYPCYLIATEISVHGLFVKPAIEWADLQQRKALTSFFLRKGNNARQAHCLPLEMGIIKCVRNMNAKVQYKSWTIYFKIFDDFWRNPGRKLQQKLGLEQLIIMRFLVETKEVWIWNIDHAYYIYFWDKVPILWLNHFAVLTTNICKSQLCNF